MKKKKKEKKNEHKNIISGTKKRWSNKIVNFIVDKILNMVLEKRPMNDNFLFLLIKKKKNRHSIAYVIFHAWQNLKK